MSDPRPFDAVTARRRLLVAALATLTADLAEQSGIKDDDHPRQQNDLRDLAFAASDYVRAVNVLPRGTAAARVAVVNRAETRELATQALHAAIREDWPEAVSAMQQIGCADGSAITLTLIAYCDTTIDAQRRMRGLPPLEDGEAEEGIVRPAWLNTETGQIDLDANAMPPEVRWAGQLVAARAALDADMFGALLGALPADGNERGQYAIALLRSCAGIVHLSQRAGGAS